MDTQKVVKERPITLKSERTKHVVINRRVYHWLDSCCNAAIDKRIGRQYNPDDIVLSEAGEPIEQIAEIVELAVCKLLNRQLPSRQDLINEQLDVKVADDWGISVEQLHIYRYLEITLSKLDRDCMTLEYRKELRNRIKSGEIDRDYAVKKYNLTAAQLEEYLKCYDDVELKDRKRLTQKFCQSLREAILSNGDTSSLILGDF
jgi:hypothetical protein